MLTLQEADHLFEVLKKAAGSGATVILITHKLREILAITDQVSIMRRGEMVALCRHQRHRQGAARRADADRKVRLKVDKGTTQPGEAKLKVEGLRR